MKYFENEHEDKEINSYLVTIDSLAQRCENNSNFYKFDYYLNKAEKVAFGYKDDEVIAKLVDIEESLKEMSF